MVFKENDLLEILRLTYQAKASSRSIADLYGCSKSSIGNFLRKETYTDFWEAHEDKPIAGGTLVHPVSKVKVMQGKKFVITSAQNNTYVHDLFLKSLHTYCSEEDAELIVSTFHYNKNGFQNGQAEDLWFDPKIRDYLCNEPVRLAKGLVFCGELNIIPTAVNPISGLHNYTGLDSAIIPHAKLQLESVPTPKYDDPKLMYTTGAVTMRNYIAQKSGQKAEHHHIFSALVVEVDQDGDWFVRQLAACTSP